MTFLFIRDTNLYNTLILVVEKYNDLPAWFYYNNPDVRTISIPNPDKGMRTIFIDKEYGEFQTDADLQKVKDKFVDQTDGLKNRELKELHALYSRLKAKDNSTELPDTLSIYKYGIVDNMWHTIDKHKLANLEESLKKRVIGQDQAVAKTVKIVKRAVSGLSGMQHSSGQNKPRGVLFFAGPTGTGKTELTKALAEQLFDEIEKAHLSIMDKFLQILEDGRMTDGQGNTVYFSETLIIFTSNLGIVKNQISKINQRVLKQNKLQINVDDEV